LTSEWRGRLFKSWIDPEIKNIFLVKDETCCNHNKHYFSVALLGLTPIFFEKWAQLKYKNANMFICLVAYLQHWSLYLKQSGLKSNEQIGHSFQCHLDKNDINITRFIWLLSTCMTCSYIELIVIMSWLYFLVSLFRIFPNQIILLHVWQEVTRT